MTLRSREQEAFAAALKSRDPLFSMRDAAAELLAAGIRRDHLLRELEDFRYEARTGQRPEDEDVVLEVMDFLDGWSSPHVKL